MAVREILLLGNESLYKVSREITKNEIHKVKQISDDLRDTLSSFRKIHGFGRAIAAPQIDEPFRMIYMIFDGNEYTLINPKLIFPSEEKYQLWDDCMSFPGLEVKLFRYKNCKVLYKDLNFNDCILEPAGDISELVQHEYDHLDGILAVQRAIDDKSLRINREKL